GNYPLENNDNSCYLNSSLQCLINLPRFIHKCLNVPYLLPDIGKKSILLRVLYENFRNIVLKQEYFRGFVRELKIHLNDFNNYHQQDSHEFLSFILDKIHDEEKLHYPESSSPAISSLFLVDIEKRILCPERHASISHDKTHILTLHLMNNNNCNLSELIAENIGKEEIIEGYRCDKCDANCDAIIEQEIVRYPLYFIIHINRAVAFFGNVVRVSVTAPEVISFEGSKHLYRLNGIINHNGWQDFGHCNSIFASTFTYLNTF
ncbi:MAG: Ubiquitin carboxyl-terminal hydrolase 8, partial [Marteilia pararefringens]